ncbi:MAG: endonuclease/exonuclease/phosphatase family protein [Bacteroidota bacterium]|nr:endonuclease/exonuclease/phosphatase family protein [Bacteroidota bacterium]
MTAFDFSGESQVLKPRDLDFMFYNVENLFDTLDDPLTNDEEFLPSSEKNWTSQRYQAKLDSLAKVIQDALGSRIGIVGLAEIENRRVLEDLVNHPTLAFRKLQIVHQESPDARGIDVALLLPKSVRTDSSYWVNIRFPEDTLTKTRDILMTRIYLGKRPVWVAVNHFPSRRGGEELSRPKRAFVAKRLKQQVDFWQAVDSSSGFIIMGDFNDEPMDSSLHLVLGAGPDSSSASLVNLFWEFQQRKLGSYRYKDEWNMLDQIIVSRNLIKGNRIQLLEPYARIYAAGYIREAEGKYKGNPFRTYAGNRYLGGFSDHFPVLTTLRYY